MVKTFKRTQKSKKKKTETGAGGHEKKINAHKEEIYVDLNKLKLTLKLLVEHDKPIYESVPVTQNVTLKATRPTNLVTSKRLLPVLMACLMNHRYEAAAKIMQALSMVVHNLDHIIYKGGLQILENHPSSTEEQIQYFIRQLKNLGFINKREIILEHLIYLLKQGKLQQAQTDVNHLLSRHRCYIRKNQVVDTTMKAYMGLLDYIQWAHLVNSSLDQTDENEKCLSQQAINCHAEKAVKAFQEVLKVPGQWDIFVLKLVEMLEYDNRIDDAIADLEMYATNNPTHLHSHIYLFEFLKRQGRDPDKQLECLKKIVRISPSDPRVLELVDMLEPRENGIEKCIRLLFTYVDQYPNKTSLKAWEKLASLIADVYKRPTQSKLNLLRRSWKSRSSYWPAYHFSSSSLHLEKKNGIKLALNKAKVLAFVTTEQTTFFELLETEFRKQNKSHRLEQLQKIISSAKDIQWYITDSSSQQSIFQDLDKNGDDFENEIENSSEVGNPDNDHANQKISDQEKNNPSEDTIGQENSEQVNKEKVKRKRKKESKIIKQNKSHSLKQLQNNTSSVRDSSFQQSTFQDLDKNEEIEDSNEAENPDKYNANQEISDQEKNNPLEDTIGQEIQENSDHVNKKKVKRKRKEESKITKQNTSHSLKQLQNNTSSVRDSSFQQSTFQDLDKNETENSNKAENPDIYNASQKISDQEKNNPCGDMIDSCTLSGHKIQENSDQLSKENISEAENPDNDYTEKKKSNKKNNNPCGDMIDSCTLTWDEIKEKNDQLNTENSKRKRKRVKEMKLCESSSAMAEELSNNEEFEKCQVPELENSYITKQNKKKKHRRE
ncbi:uncharacterized protein LOC106467819 [Limulus polyphemus]|uniref:Uncharacterized protein LOC106467819 n=1 Tax=Limulus polyphemus TaxID=6850 RepID=A0ABM1BK89_LIMPO|nr:uncharacterized protein LOC106467819 [Limulus polyphemus]XP_022251720.1 uncharacterized protein LOC106467819 [Limulus polyphemus]